MEQQLLIEMDIQEDFGYSLIRALLTCGHYSTPIHPASSTWDFPDDACRCSEGCGDRQMDVRLQAQLYAGMADRD